MFTIQEIETAAQKVKSGADFPQFAATLKALGVTRFDVYVINGISIYFGKNDGTVEGSAAYEPLVIEQTPSPDELREALKNHQDGQIDYQTFCRQAAGAGVEKWIVDLELMTVSYLDVTGNEIVVEKIKF